MITLLQNHQIVPMGFFQGLRSDDDLEEEALRRIQNYQEGDDLESIFHLIQTWGGRSGRNIYVRGNGFNWSSFELAYKELVQSCLSVHNLDENEVEYLSHAVDCFTTLFLFMTLTWPAMSWTKLKFSPEILLSIGQK